jgi:hypothetical protein
MDNITSLVNTTISSLANLQKRDATTDETKAELRISKWRTVIKNTSFSLPNHDKGFR